MIDLTLHEDRLARAIEQARKKRILIPTFEEQKRPEKIDPRVKEKLRRTGRPCRYP